MCSIIALDLEGTLISSAEAAHPRPGLREFLEFCVERFARAVLFTAVSDKDKVRGVWTGLVTAGYVPQALAQIEIVQWSGRYKSLAFVAGDNREDVLLVEDNAGWVDPVDRANWLPIQSWHAASGQGDCALAETQRIIQKRLNADQRLKRG